MAELSASLKQAKRYRLTLALLLAAAHGQAAAAPPACTGADFYFPPGSFPRHYPASDEERRRWYAEPLARLGEPSLSCGHSPDLQSYRLLWLNGLAHPVTIRITRSAGAVMLHAFQLSGWGRADPGKLAAYSHRRLAEADWNRLQAALAAADFWRLPTSGNLYGIHGGQWVIEGNDQGRYHLVDRWSPASGTYRTLGDLFFELADWARPYPNQ
ncbi:hypothetical protein A3710_20280 [Stutzerimonas frequens]|uniref:hypothetical protein n=1 Tax=Stutzerimonas frequens TaxID=2968969 RepID=UPI0007BA6954|nr:hypothetical protein [Stutzerimonas frequens]KZX58643.1 hypothetical protein A3710_20280 [Stutzerimonas frequens]